MARALRYVAGLETLATVQHPGHSVVAGSGQRMQVQRRARAHMRLRRDRASAFAALTASLPPLIGIHPH